MTDGMAREHAGERKSKFNVHNNDQGSWCEPSNERTTMLNNPNNKLCDPYYTPRGHQTPGGGKLSTKSVIARAEACKENMHNL